MIFPSDQVALIASRRKTQGRVPVQFVSDRQPAKLLPCRFQIGRAYRVQARRDWTVSKLAARARVEQRIQPSRARAVVSYLDAPLDATLPPTGLQITVVDVRRELLGDLTPQDARREGFRFTAEFMARWERTHGLVDPDLHVWVISFAVGDLRDQFDRPRLLTSIRHVGHVAYEVDSSGRQHWPANDDHSEDYTDRPDLAMRASSDPGEGLTEAQLKPYVRDAHLRDLARQRDSTERSHARSLAIRLKDAQKRRDADELAKIRGELELLEHQIRTAA